MEVFTAMVVAEAVGCWLGAMVAAGVLGWLEAMVEVCLLFVG